MQHYTDSELTSTAPRGHRFMLNLVDESDLNDARAFAFRMYGERGLSMLVTPGSHRLIDGRWFKQEAGFTVYERIGS